MVTFIERAKQAAREGYSIAENIYCRGLYEVRRPDGTKYTVDAAAQSCNCPASVVCKHIGLVQISLRYVAALDRKAARPAPRRRFSTRHIATLRNLAPIMAGSKPAPAPAHVWTPEAIALRERCEARIARDFNF